MTERKKFLLRLPPKLHDELRAWAEQEMKEATRLRRRKPRGIAHRPTR